MAQRKDYKTGRVFDLHGYDFEYLVMPDGELHTVAQENGEVLDSSPVWENDFTESGIMDFIRLVHEQTGLIAGVDYTIKACS